MIFPPDAHVAKAVALPATPVDAALLRAMRYVMPAHRLRAARLVSAAGADVGGAWWRVGRSLLQVPIFKPSFAYVFWELALPMVLPCGLESCKVNWMSLIQPQA